MASRLLSEKLAYGPSDVARSLPGNMTSAQAADLWLIPGFPGVDDAVLGKIVDPAELREWVRARVASIRTVAKIGDNRLGAAEMGKREQQEAGKDETGGFRLKKGKNVGEIKRYVTLPDGSRRRRSFCGRTLEEAERKWKRARFPALAVDISEGSFSWWAAFKWLPLKVGLEESYLRMLADSLDLLEPRIGSLAVGDVTATVLAEALADIEKTITRFGRPIAKSSVNRARRVALEINGLAAEEKKADLINPKRVRRRKEPRKHVEVYRSAEIRALVCAAKGSVAYAPVLLMLCLGLTINEARATLASDLADGVLRARNVMGSGDRRKSKMKTDERPRDLPLPPGLREEMQEIAAASVAAAKKTGGEAWLCSGEAGTLLELSNLRRSLYAAMKRAGVWRLTPHECRHSYASWLDDHGCPRGTKRALMGHARSSVEDRYTHSTVLREWLGRLWNAAMEADELPLPEPARLGPRTPARGNYNGRAVLTEEQVAEIRWWLEKKHPLASIARHYGVSPKAIQKIREGKAWVGVAARRPDARLRLLSNAFDASVPKKTEILGAA